MKWSHSLHGKDVREGARCVSRPAIAGAQRFAGMASLMTPPQTLNMKLL